MQGKTNIHVYLTILWGKSYPLTGLDIRLSDPITFQTFCEIWQPEI